MKTYIFTTWYENDKNREIKVRFNTLEYAIRAFNEAIKYDEKCRIYKINETQCGTKQNSFAATNKKRGRSPFLKIFRPIRGRFKGSDKGCLPGKEQVSIGTTAKEPDSTVKEPLAVKHASQPRRKSQQEVTRLGRVMKRNRAVLNIHYLQLK